MERGKKRQITVELVGYCKECGSEVFDCDEIKDYPEIYECGVCCHPNSRRDLWDVVPDYILIKESKNYEEI